MLTVVYVCNKFWCVFQFQTGLKFGLFQSNKGSAHALNQETSPGSVIPLAAIQKGTPEGPSSFWLVQDAVSQSGRNRRGGTLSWAVGTLRRPENS